MDPAIHLILEIVIFSAPLWLVALLIFLARGDRPREGEPTTDYNAVLSDVYSNRVYRDPNAHDPLAEVREAREKA